MPTFDVEAGGKSFEVEAPDAQSAAMGAQKYANDTAITPDALLRQGVRGIPVIGGLANKFAAMMDAATQPVLGRGSSAPTYEQRYAENYPAQEAQDVAFEQANPVTSTLAQLGGGTAALGPIAGTELGAIGLGLKGTSLGSRTAASILSGAGINAADAAVRGGDVSTNALIGGGLGAVLPAGAQAIGAGMRAAKGALAATPTTSQPENLVRIFGQDLPLTNADITGNRAAQALEQGGLRGQEGTLAQTTVAQPFFEGRQAKIGQTVQAAQEAVSPTGAVHAENPTEAGNIVGGALASTKQAAQQAVDNLYEPVRANATVIPADSFSYLARRVKADLTTAKDQVRIDRNTTPAAAKMLDQLDQFRGVPIDRANFLAPSQATGSTMADIDQFRQTLLATKANASTFQDQRAAGRVIGAFDKQIGQIAPSPELQAARAAHSQYRQTFFQNGPGDTVGRDMEAILGSKRGAQSATPAEVATKLYGSPEGNSPRLVERLKEVFGEQSPEFASIKQGLLSRILEQQSGQPWESGKMATQLEKALFETKQAPLTQAVFNAQERAELAKFAAYLRKITPKPGTVNYSGTAAPLLKYIKGYLPKAVLGGLGAHIGGPLGALAGATIAGPIGERFGAAKVARSLYGTRPIAPLSPAAAAAIRSIQLLPPVLAPQLSQPIAPPINQ